MNSTDLEQRQLATALFLIDRGFLRVGNEKDADVDFVEYVGVLNLRRSHLQFDSSKKIVRFEVPSKSSLVFRGEFVASPHLFQNLQRFVADAGANEPIFNHLLASKIKFALGKAIGASYLRKFNVSATFQAALRAAEIPTDASLEQKLIAFNKANWATVQNQLIKRESVPEGVKKQREQTDAAEERLGTMIDEWFATPTDRQTEFGAREISRMADAIVEAQVAAKAKTKLYSVALGTNKIANIDPRLTVEWARRNQVPLESVWPGTIRQRCGWAIDAKPEELQALNYSI